MAKKIIIGTRGSDLAMWQANYTKSLLEEQGHEVELKIIQTSGDKSQQWNTSFDKLEGKGFFTKELEDALLNKEIDVAVHSHKDLPTTNPEGLIIAGVSEREDPSELLLIRKDKVDDSKQFSLAEGINVGTSSARRKSQLLAFRPDLKINDLRGNVPTRIKKLKEHQYDAIVLANAGVERLKLDLSEFHQELLDPKIFVPAPAQGVLAWQIHEDNDAMQAIFDKLTDIDVQTRINVERQVLNQMDGGCQLPLGVYTETEIGDDDRPVFKTWVSCASEWNKQPLQLYFESQLAYDMPEKIVSHINGIKPQRVFITKNFREQDYLPNALKRLNFQIDGQSLIEFKQITIKELPRAEWIFFSSKHAVKYFFNQKPEIGKVKFGCVGTATSKELRQRGYRADFIGQSNDTKLIGKQFAARVGNSKVLFPIAKESMQSIQQQIINQENVINLPVYATIKHSKVVNSDYSVIIFTSPSNVQAYFEKNKWQTHQKAVAMGDATGSALERLKIRHYVKPISFDDLGLFQAVLQQSL
ncbi:MAG: hydroxymethylbilane synthase [Bacteroidia bacterium]